MRYYLTDKQFPWPDNFKVPDDEAELAEKMADMCPKFFQYMGVRGDHGQWVRTCLGCLWPQVKLCDFWQAIAD